MDLKCKKCDNVYEVCVNGFGQGFVGHVVVSWNCLVCGCWNVYPFALDFVLGLLEKILGVSAKNE